MDGEITPEEVERLLAEDADIRVVDIRSPGAYTRGHIPGSENIPLNQLPTRVASLSGSERIVTVCPHGESSVQAARLIASFEGTTDAVVESMAGGLNAWGGELEAGASDTDGAAAAADDGPQSPF
ncbi:rhodanese-like domain-containing protein [Halobaculum rubrum]|uniref:rhodanese-like domain-containing protein n=1 Tax=Halobaculum rubrum TaxID=2872158 RepID=UPI001CA463F9|nr:rhodanese-like domain-containing protein [Halobaculum rubrum]QZX98264.1 rhodanese-like domain-containing protein [Halobaculum rubrum]